MSSSFVCPLCGAELSKVTDSRPCQDGVRRRRKCLVCGARWTTRERMENDADLTGGLPQEMNLENLRSRIYEAVETAWADTVKGDVHHGD